MSWQTPSPLSQASCAPVCTSVAPGTYATRSRTQDAMTDAACTGSAPATRSRAAADSAGSTVVRGVAARNSAASPASAWSRSSAQDSGSGGGGAAMVSTMECDRTSNSSCGAWMSNELTRVPQ